MNRWKPALIVAAAVLGAVSLGLLLVGSAWILGDPAPGRGRSADGSWPVFGAMLAAWAATGCAMAALDTRRRMILGVVLIVVAILGAMSVDRLGGGAQVYGTILWAFDLLAMIAWMAISLGGLIWLGLGRLLRTRPRSAGAAGR